MNDTQILELFAARDERAISAAKKQYENGCFKIALQILQRREDAEEAVNDMWLKVWDSIPPAKPEKLFAYLSTAVRNCSLDLLASRNAAKRGAGEYPAALEELSECLAGAENPEQQVDAKLLRDAIGTFLSGISADARTIFVERYTRLTPVNEIAEKFGISTAKVKVSLMRTRNKLKTYLKKELVMTSKDLLNAAMQLDQSFLDEADQRAAAAIPAGRKRIQLISAISAAAACLTAVVGLRIYSLHHQNGLTEQSSAPDSIVAEVIPETETTTTVTETTAADAETKRAATTLVSASNTSKSKQTESTTATAAVSGTAKTTASKGNAGTTKGSTAVTQAAKSDTVSSTTTTTSRNRGKTTVVPYLLYLTWEDAEAEARDNGLKVTKKVVDHFDQYDAYYSGLVVAQSIEPETKVEKETVIELTVLTGEVDPDYYYTDIPDFTGLTWAQAEYKAKSYRLKLTKQIVKEGNGKKGTVQSQSPEYDNCQTRVKKNTNITLKVLEGEPDPIVAQFFFVTHYAYIGKYHIDLYADGKRVFVGPQFQPHFSHSEHTLLDFAGEGSAEYEAMLVNDETGKEAKIGRYYVDFDTMDYTVLEENSVQAFRQLGGIAPDDTFEYEKLHLSTWIFFFPETEVHKDEVQFKIPADASGIFKIVAYADGIACADSGWFDAGVPDTVITLTLEDNLMRPYGGRYYLFEMYPKDPNQPILDASGDRWESWGVGRADINYNNDSNTDITTHVREALYFLGGVETYEEPGESADSNE